MSPLLYAVTDGDPAAIEGTGIDGGALRGIACDGLVAVVGEDGELDLSEEQIWRYEEVVEALMASRAILPARLGSVVEDDETVRATLRARREQLTTALDEVRGAVELALRGIWSDGAEAPVEAEPSGAKTGTGASYMLGRLRLLHRAEQIASRLEPLRLLARRSTECLLVRPSVPFLGCYLVVCGRVGEFGSVVVELDVVLVGVGLWCSGRWARVGFSGVGDAGRVA
jgi:hypothetical protein